jgi:peptidoglycan/LPS O-acetylase OafA/YrhL
VAALAINILALTSDVFQWILASAIPQFLAQVSYTLYLLHVLIVYWAQRDTYEYMIGEGVEAEEAVLYIFFIYTPILCLASWILEVIVDRPSKQFAGEFDRQTRRNRPTP